MPEVTSMSPQSKRVTVDVEEKKIDEFSLGDEVEIKVRGKVVELNARREFSFGPNKEDKDVDPPSITVERSKVTIDLTESNQFSELAEEEDGD